jgi:mRNA interferase RelE/StbE
MDSYRIEWKRSATQELRRLPREIVGRILKVVEQLSTDPYPSGVRKLVGSEHTYRIRVGDYRIIYSILASALLIEIT